MGKPTCNKTPVQCRVPLLVTIYIPSFPGRYYIKRASSSEPLLRDDLASTLWRDSHVDLLQLEASEVAVHITARDAAVFRQIHPAEYIHDLFGVK
jgi:hypothetical protein